MKQLLGRASTLIIVVVAVIIIGLLLSFSSQFFYFFEKVDAQEVGVQLESGEIKNVVGPGVYSDAGLYVELQRISTHAIPFSVTDPEIITKDKQRIGLTVSGDIFRPNATEKDKIQNLWAQYKEVFLNDDLAKMRVDDLAQQAMKVCVGDRNFDDNIIGTARDELRNCIDDELNGMAENLGLNVQNLVVPEVILSPEVQAALDAIVQSRLQTEKAAQDKLRADAEALAEQARQEGEIRVEQSRIQEQTRQQITLAELEKERTLAQKAVIEANLANDLAKVEAERAVIEAQKSNDLFAAQKDVEINQVAAQAALEKARAELAPQLTLAELYGTDGYLLLQQIQANADALNSTDKLIFTPEGTVPTLVIPGPGIMPTVDTASPAPAAGGGQGN